MSLEQSVAPAAPLLFTKSFKLFVCESDQPRPPDESQGLDHCKINDVRFG